MQKFLLQAILIPFFWQPLAYGQDDDAVLGATPAEVPASNYGNSITDDSDPEPAPPPASPPKNTQIDATPNPENKETALTPAPTVEPQAEPEGPSILQGRRKPGSTFGFGVAKPISIGKYDHYKYLYGEPRSYPAFYAGYYLGSYLFDLGLVGRTGYYSAQGNPLKLRSDVGTTPFNGNITGLEKDADQRVSLTMIPLQLTAEVSLSPFKTRWVVFKVWMGMEVLFVQETIEPKLPSTTSTASSGTYTSSGWNTGIVTGGMASFSLTGLDARADYSMRAMGIDRLYISVSLDLVKTAQAKMGNFDRKTYGIAFSFEGLR